MGMIKKKESCLAGCIPDAIVKTAKEVLADQVSSAICFQNLLKGNGIGDIGQALAFL